MKENIASFYDRPEWVALRYEVMRAQGAKCAACNTTREKGAVLHVDHVKPRSIYPELALSRSNLQVLCAPCNMGKSNKFTDDFRRTPPKRARRKSRNYLLRFNTKHNLLEWYLHSVLPRYANRVSHHCVTAMMARETEKFKQLAAFSSHLRELTRGLPFPDADMAQPVTTQFLQMFRAEFKKQIAAARNGAGA